MDVRKPVITVIGSLSIDYTTLTPRFPSHGETVTAKSLTISPGGKGANQAAACGRSALMRHGGDQDVRVKMVGAVGGKHGDQWSTVLKPLLEDSGVNCKNGIREIPESRTGTATIIVDEVLGENWILVVPEANHEGMFDSEEVLGRVFGTGDEPDVLVMQGEIPGKTVFDILRYNQRKTRRSSQIVLNPAPMFPDPIPLKLLQDVNLVVNETEIIQLVESSLKSQISIAASAVLDRQTLDHLAKEFHAAGVQALIVTLGAKGVYCSMQTEGVSDECLEQALIAGVKVPKVVETTAAGDTFIGYYATALARWHTRNSGKFQFVQAVEVANRAAALCVQRPGSMISIPWGYEVSQTT